MSQHSFGARLRAAMDERGPVCAGIDPHPSLLRQWGLDVSVSGLETFAMTCVEAYAGSAAAVKPQSAFFEVFGSAGIAVLERVLAELSEADTISILDVKRGDIGTTMDAYAQAFLGEHAPAAADAITLSPYLGYGSLRPAIDVAAANGRGVFVLALTSNLEGAAVQHAEWDGRSVARAIVEQAGLTNSAEAGHSVDGTGLGHVGLVVGATVGQAITELGIDLAASAAPILAPGFGAQGALVADLPVVFGAAARNVLVASSRELLGAGPSPAAIRAAVRSTAHDALTALAQ